MCWEKNVVFFVCVNCQPFKSLRRLNQGNQTFFFFFFKWLRRLNYSGNVILVSLQSGYSDLSKWWRERLKGDQGDPKGHQASSWVCCFCSTSRFCLRRGCQRWCSTFWPRSKYLWTNETKSIQGRNFGIWPHCRQVSRVFFLVLFCF